MGNDGLANISNLPKHTVLNGYLVLLHQLTDWVPHILHHLPRPNQGRGCLQQHFLSLVRGEPYRLNVSPITALEIWTIIGLFKCPEIKTKFDTAVAFQQCAYLPGEEEFDPNSIVDI